MRFCRRFSPRGPNKAHDLMTIPFRPSVLATEPVGCVGVRKRAMRAVRSNLAVLCICALSACYFPRQAAFEKSVHQQVQVNMRVAAAQENLGKLKLNCYRQGPQLDCARTIESLAPPITCVQHVVLKPSEPGQLVAEIRIGKISCLGPFG